LQRAGSERKDGLGRVVHFHSFRKSMQSLGVCCGINQRAAQEILGHPEANLTAQAYAGVASLQLHDEIAKLPWIPADGAGAHISGFFCIPRCHSQTFSGNCSNWRKPLGPMG